MGHQKYGSCSWQEVVTMADSHPSSSAVEDIHRNVLAAIQLEKAALKKQLQELEAVEAFHARRAGVEITASPKPDALIYQSDGSVLAVEAKAITPSATKHDAAAFALNRIGKPAKIGQIADFLVSVGYGVGVDRRIFFNGLYTALKRREDLFERAGEARWRLRETEKEGAADG
jgi:hypothetical protein